MFLSREQFAKMIGDEGSDDSSGGGGGGGGGGVHSNVSAGGGGGGKGRRGSARVEREWLPFATAEDVEAMMKMLDVGTAAFTCKLVSGSGRQESTETVQVRVDGSAVSVYKKRRLRSNTLLHAFNLSCVEKREGGCDGRVLCRCVGVRVVDFVPEWWL